MMHDYDGIVIRDGRREKNNVDVVKVLIIQYVLYETMTDKNKSDWRSA
jgi:hypothetical protein